MKYGRLAAAAALAIASVGFTAPTFAAPVSVDIRVAPPAPRHEWVPAARPGYVWAPGYWDYRNNRYRWVSGHWERERPGYYYHGTSWVQHGERWYIQPGGWRRVGDRDRDGIPNRYDRDRDNDHIPNRYDRDRDGDGVPNRYDDRPDNPRRH
jgi:hypothetical protein